MYCTYQLKLRINFWNARAKNFTSRFPLGAVILYTRQTAHAWTGGLTSENSNSYAGICPFGAMYHSLKNKMS